jgi:cation diffusion facilitator CzcD-associated flavoprotein CzcO
MRITIIGSGFSGICLGIQLKRAGIHSFSILEKSERLGGTWRDNTYPGAACDLASFAYCFSFEQKTDWSRKWSPQSEILECMEQCARKHELLPHIRFGTEVEGARFDDRAGVWRIRTRDGELIESEVLVSGVGQLSRPYTPEIPGLADFQGECFHSARWNHGYDLDGKRVAVIGNAASAIQFIPQIASRVKQLYIFQRSANWMLPRNDRAFTELEKRLFTRVPLLARLYRWRIWLRQELMFPLFLGKKFLGRGVAKAARQHIRDQISDPELQELLVPDYPVGGKRILISDDYYQSLERGNVEVVAKGIARVTSDALETEGGDVYPVDAVIVATGFESTSFLAPMEIQGLDHRSLATEWKDGARAYLGLCVAGFPNFFMMYGPNTNLGHNSIIFMIECQTRYILDCIRQLDARALRYLDLKQEVMDAFDARLQEELSRTVWAATDHSWYKNRDGRITNNWSGTTIRYWWNTRKADLTCYRQQERSSGT